MCDKKENKQNNREEKTTSEKPASLSHLSLKEALEGLLKIETVKKSLMIKQIKDKTNNPHLKP